MRLAVVGEHPWVGRVQACESGRVASVPRGGPRQRCCLFCPSMRPDGPFDPRLDLEPVALRLARLVAATRDPKERPVVTQLDAGVVGHAAVNIR